MMAKPSSFILVCPNDRSRHYPYPCYMEQLTGSKLGKEYNKSMLSPCLFNLYAEYIMRNAGLEEAQAGIKIARRNINNLRYADDTMLTVESKDELKSLLMKVKKESEKVGLKTQHSEN